MTKEIAKELDNTRFGKLDEKTNSSESELSDFIPKAAGYVSYDVSVHCPHCKKQLYLNQYPYINYGDDDNEYEYELAEDELRRELFGSTTVPEKWKDLDIKYKCCGCEKEFILNTLEI